MDNTPQIPDMSEVGFDDRLRILRRYASIRRGARRRG